MISVLSPVQRKLTRGTVSSGILCGILYASVILSCDADPFTTDSGQKISNFRLELLLILQRFQLKVYSLHCIALHWSNVSICLFFLFIHRDSNKLDNEINGNIWIGYTSTT